MRIVSYFFITASLLVGCNNTKSNKTSTTDEALISTLQEQLIASDDPLQRININNQILDLQFKSASEEDKQKFFDDAMQLNWVEIQRLNEKEYQYLENYHSYRHDENWEPKEPHDSIKQKEKPYLDAGLEFIDIGEGFVALDFSSDFYDKYIKQLPENYQEYWYLLRDSENIAPDAVLIITWRQIADLIARYEAYAQKYPENIGFFKILAQNYEFLQRVFIIGTDNSSIVDENGQLLSELKTEWERFSKAYPKSPTTKLIQIALAEKQYVAPHIYMLMEKIDKTQSASDDPYMSNMERY